MSDERGRSQATFGFGNVIDLLSNVSSAGTALALFAILLLVAGIRGPDLFTGDGLTLAFAVSAPLILATLALVVPVMAGRGGIDLSIGPMMGFINVVAVEWIYTQNGIGSPAAIVAFALVAGLAIGATQGLVIASLRLQPVIVTLGGFLIFAGVNLLIMPQTGGSVPSWLGTLATNVGGFPTPLIVLAGAGAAWFFLSRSTIFRNIRMLGGNERAAFVSGVPLVRTQVAAFAIGGLFAGTAALMFTALIASGDPNQGSNYTLQAVTALVLGGTGLAGGRGTAIGSVAGALDVYLINYVIGTIDFGKFSGYVSLVSYGLVLVLALVIGKAVPQIARAVVRQGLIK